MKDFNSDQTNGDVTQVGATDSGTLIGTVANDVFLANVSPDILTADHVILS